MTDLPALISKVVRDADRPPQIKCNLSSRQFAEGALVGYYPHCSIYRNEVKLFALGCTLATFRSESNCFGLLVSSLCSTNIQAELLLAPRSKVCF